MVKLKRSARRQIDDFLLENESIIIKKENVERLFDVIHVHKGVEVWRTHECFYQELKREGFNLEIREDEIEIWK